MWLMRWARSTRRRWPCPFISTKRNRSASEEGTGAGQLTFGVAIDPVNKDAVQRQKADLPMLDVYSADAGKRNGQDARRACRPPPGHLAHAADVLVVLKRWKSFSREAIAEIFEIH